MKNKIMGFVGLDVQDTILYLSRIFYHMGKSVLMVDFSESQALYYSMPFIPGLDAQNAMVEYRSTYFTCKPLQEKEMEAFDVILFFFGFKLCPEINYCTHLVYTTDCDKNHIDKISNIKNHEKEYKQLVYRNAGNKWLKAYKLPLAEEIREECQYIHNDSRREKRLRLQCQYNEIFGFRGLSGSFKRYLKDTVKAVFPEESEGKGFQGCFKRAEMGI